MDVYREFVVSLLTLGVNSATFFLIQIKEAIFAKHEINHNNNQLQNRFYILFNSYKEGSLHDGQQPQGPPP
ncbi:hypothetical protein BDF21DRAFT_433885 [Thamnidium elegans]|nr:hypothetical protein BDF21DRAFT_433885 [Thamnidium elegans]